MKLLQILSAYPKRTRRAGLYAGGLLLLLLVGHYGSQANWRYPWFSVPALLAQSNGPTLTIPTTLTASVTNAVASHVAAPIAFVTNGSSITSMAFSINFDESCLAFDPTDSVGNGIPDALQFTNTLSPQSKPSVAYNANDTQGELDIVIADYAPPLQLIPDAAALVMINFSTICVPAPGSSQFAAVRFSAHPRPSFGNPLGLDVTGAGSDGGVEISSPALPTNTPTATATFIPTAPSTEVATAIATETPNGTPSATPTGPATGTPVVTKTPTPQATTTPVGTAGNAFAYLPLVAR